MNAKELRAAAESKLKEGVDVMLAEYVLDTVREDDDELVTPERLVELGGKVYANRPGCVSFDGLEFVFSNDCLTLVKAHQPPLTALHLMGKFLPHNMQEARQLLERCGVEVK